MSESDHDKHTVAIYFRSGNVIPLFADKFSARWHQESGKLTELTYKGLDEQILYIDLNAVEAVIVR